MRIITGKARGMKLATLDGEDITRPTTERVKEGVFSAVQFDIAGKRVLDLFAGSGQMALEALSRGADSAVLIDENTDAIAIIKENAKKTGVMKQCAISRMDYSEYLKSVAGKERFDIVFLDPPYRFKVNRDIILYMRENSMLSKEAIIISEQDEKNKDIDGFEKKEYTYSSKYVSIYRRIEE